jgi:hypothetical protein
MKKLVLLLIVILLISSVSASNLPSPGGDNETWGVILNDYLSRIAGSNATELNLTMVNGTNIYSSSINTSHILDGTILVGDLSDDSVNSSKIDLTEVTLVDFTNDANYLDKDDGGTVNGDLIVNGNFSLIGSYLNATVTNQYLNGSFLPSATNLFDLGSSSVKWNNLYLTKVLATDWTNVTITESQISNLQSYLTSESDPTYTAWDKDYDDLTNKPTIPTLWDATFNNTGNTLWGSGGNSSFNQTLTDTLYAGVEWDYNQSTATYNMYNTDWSSTYNASYLSTYNATYAANSADGNASSICANNETYLSGEGSCNNLTALYAGVEWDYNQTAPANTYTDSQDVVFNTSMKNYVDTQISGVSEDNASWNESYADTLYAGVEWDYNQSTATYNMYNTDWSSTYNASYEGSLNNASYLSTYNASYAANVADGTGSWTNTSTLTSTDLHVNITTGNLTVANGQVGIGVTSPTTKLVVSEMVQIQGDTQPLYPTSGAGLELGYDSNWAGGDTTGTGVIIAYDREGTVFKTLRLSSYDYVFETDGATKVVFENSGEVGIGTESPEALLDVGGDSGNDGEILVCSDASRCATLEADDSDNWIHVGSTTNHDFNIIRNETSRLYLDDAQILFRNSSGTNIMALKDSSKLGIGTTNPTHELNVVGSVNVTQNLHVENNLTVEAIHEVNLGGDGAATYSETQYLQNYILEINSTMSNDAAMIPNDILINYCGDIDGCVMRGHMHYYDGAVPGATNVVTLSYDTSSYVYRLENFVSTVVATGTDGDSTETNLWNLGPVGSEWNGCVLTDYNIIAGVAQNDGEYGIWWHWDTSGYNDAAKRCVLVIED